MAIPLLFSTVVSGTTLTLTIMSDPSYGANVTNYDVMLGYSTALANYVSTTTATGFTGVSNGATAGSVSLSGFTNDADLQGQPAGSVLATLAFTLKMSTTDFPITLSNTALNEDAPTSGSADPSVACFLRGTLITTATGPTPVEDLQTGDLVVTAFDEHRPIRWIGTRSYDSRFTSNHAAVLPVRFETGALGHGLPLRPLLVSPDHALLLDGALIPAKLLVNGSTITRTVGLQQIDYFHVELDNHDVLLAEGAPAESFVDCDSRAMFQNAHTFEGDSLRWTFCAPRLEEGDRLARIRRQLDPANGAIDGPTQGHLDWVTHTACAGWVWAPGDMEASLDVEILAGGGVLGRVTANQLRQDVRDQGFGTGRYGFTFDFARPLPRWMGHEVAARVVDGTHLVGTFLLEPVAELSSDDLPALAAAVRSHAATPEGVQAVARVFADEFRPGQVARRKFQAPVAIVLDDRLPTPDRDAGSVVIVSHMQALVRLGYHVIFAPIDRSEAEIPGIECAPSWMTIEDVLRRHADAALVYVHRIASMATYGQLIRRHCPGARLLYAVADLHFLRTGRQAQIEASAPLMADSQRLRAQELAGVRLADVTVTHSPVEAELLRRLVPTAVIRVVPWTVDLCAADTRWSGRSGIIFVGGMDHAPNLDAFRWLAGDLMPRIATLDPSIICTVAGSGLRPDDHAMMPANMRALGAVPDLAPIYASARVAIAPIRFGAGIKGKVLQALAAGLPCVMTTMAAEGLGLPAPLDSLCTTDADEFAALVVRLHHSRAMCSKLSRAGLAFVEKGWSSDRVDQALIPSVVSARAARFSHPRKVGITATT